MFIMICGRPRAGKTTYSERYEGIYPILHMDKIGWLNQAEDMVRKLDDVVIDGLFSYPHVRKGFLNAYKGHYKQCIWIDTPMEIIRERMHHSKIGEIRFEPPTLEEGWDEIIIIRGDDDVECISR